MENLVKDGYIKLYRKLLFSQIWKSKSSALKVVAITCLLKASHKDTYWGQILIKRGSFITSQRKLAQECTIRRETLRHCLETLKQTQFLTLELTHCFSIISILNYELYQSSTDPAIDPQTDPKWPNRDTSSGLFGSHNQLKENYNIVSKEKQKVNNSVENLVKYCGNCGNYETEHIDVKGNKSGYCHLLQFSFPPYTDASGCEQYQPKESEVKA